MTPKFRLNRRGVSEILKTQCGPAVNEAAGRIAEQVRSKHPDVEVAVDQYRTDRQAAGVTIADPQGMALQASDGALTRAAAVVGLEVKAK